MPLSVRVAHRGLHRPNQCPLCDQEQEIVQHTFEKLCLLSKKVWCLLLRRSGLTNLSLLVEDEVFWDLWIWINTLVPGHWKKQSKLVVGLLVLGAWMILRHKNECFNGAAPNVQVVLIEKFIEGNFWCMASAKGLAQLLAAVF